jgi:serine/threonine protein kinase
MAAKNKNIFVENGFHHFLITNGYRYHRSFQNEDLFLFHFFQGMIFPMELGDEGLKSESQQKTITEISSVLVEDFEPQKHLGRGGYGSVFHSLYRPTGAEFAVKRVLLSAKLSKRYMVKKHSNVYLFSLNSS